MKTNRTVVGVDTAKRVFQLHWIDMETGEIVDLKLTRAKFLEHFANRAPCLVAMEACGGSTAASSTLAHSNPNKPKSPCRSTHSIVLYVRRNQTQSGSANQPGNGRSHHRGSMHQSPFERLMRDCARARPGSGCACGRRIAHRFPAAPRGRPLTRRGTGSRSSAGRTDPTARNAAASTSNPTSRIRR